MTPNQLSSFVYSSAQDVFTQHNLDNLLIPAEPVIERPKNPDHGDYATNLALQLGNRTGVAPRDLAQWLADSLNHHPEIAEASVAGPGFINIRLSSAAQGSLISDVIVSGDSYGDSDTYSGITVNLEFVSANPTGPIHIGGTRWAAVGDSLGRVLEANGAEVTREYYFNDHGEQIDRFARSLLAAAKGEPTPEDGYGGEYINDIAGEILAHYPNALGKSDAQEFFRSHGVDMMFEHIKKSLHDFGTDFDVYFHENSLFESGAVERSIEKLKQNGYFYEQDGAWWLKSTDFGDDRDRVVIKSDGNAAYIAGDIAYIEDKIGRGHDLCIYMLGADHHGYVSRLKAAAGALGYDPDTIEVLIGQMVNLLKDGQAVRMSKRAGTVITLDDLVDAVGVDGARYALVRSSTDTTLDIDIAVWASKSNDNPIYYVQYAYTRLNSLKEKAARLGVSFEGADYSLLSTELDGELIRTIAEFPKVNKAAAVLREPHRVARYCEELAGAIHRFYAHNPILPKAGGEEQPIHKARLGLVEAAWLTLSKGLHLCGVSAPDHM